MMKVLIVDDDFLVRMYLRQLINWEHAGCTLIEDAANGKQALERMQDEQPDIVLTDISMPVLDGIELIRTLKERGNPARIAVLSCHDEFEFVKEAMRLGADEYVLKNALNADGLLELLNTLKSGLAQSRQQHAEQQRLQNLAERGSQTLLCAMVRQLRAQPLPFEEQQALLQRHGISQRFYQCAALEVRPSNGVLDAAVRDACARYAGKNAMVLVDFAGEMLTLLVDLTGISSAQQAREQARAWEDGLQQQICGKEAVLAVSGVCTGDGSLTRALTQAELAAKHAFYGERVLRFEELPPLAAELPEAGAQAVRLARLPSCDSVQFAALFLGVLDSAAQAPIEPEAVRGWIASLDEGCALRGAEPPLTLEDCRTRAPYYERLLTERAARARLQTENPAVAQAIAYMDAHFAEQLTLAQVAEQVGLNPTYLSFVFKRDSGQNFSEYLLSCRLNAVKRGLRESTAPIKEVAAAAGFLDYRHFCKLFKKETDLRPADFRGKTKK